MTFRDTAPNECRNFAAEKRNPDGVVRNTPKVKSVTPKVILITPKVIYVTPKVIYVTPKVSDSMNPLEQKNIMALELNVTKNTNTAIQGTAGKYYARVEYKGMYSVLDLARYIAKHSSTYTAGEISGMLTDLVTAIKELTLLGYVVKIDNLGLFKASVDANGLTIAEKAKVSAGLGRQRTDEEIAAKPEVQQFAVGAVKMIMQATGDTTISAMTSDAKLSFTSKAKEKISALAGGQAVVEDDGGNDDTVATPVISGATPFAETTQVTISGPAGASIYYTADGSTPTEESTVYNAPLTLNNTATIKAIAVKDNVSSEVATKFFQKQSGGGNNDGGDNGGGLDMG